MNLVCPRCNSMIADKEEYNRCGRCGALVSSRLPVKDAPVEEEAQTPKKRGRKRELPTEEEMVGCTRGT